MVSSSAMPVLSVNMLPSSLSVLKIDTSKDVKHMLDTVPEIQSIPPEFILPVEKRPSSVHQGSIPVIDLGGLDGSDSERMWVIQEISSACKEWGCFLITNHGVKQCLMEELNRVLEDFYSLPWEQKVKYVSDDVTSPVRYGTSLNTPLVDENTRYWRDYLRHFGHPLENNIQHWPADPLSYRDVAKRFLEKTRVLALNIAEAVSQSLGLERDHIEKAFGQGWQIMAANFYPRCPQPNLTLGLSPHWDHGALTLLVQNDVDGLQVKHKGRWVAVRPTPDMFTVILGNYMEVLSNGRYKSVEHRTVVNKERMRITVAVGHRPEHDAIMAPAHQLVEKDGGPRFKALRFGDYMKLQQTIVSKGKHALEALAFQQDTGVTPSQSAVESAVE